MVVVVDDDDRENEGDLLMAAEFVTADAVNFMATEGRGLVCLALTPERCDALGLPLMVTSNEAPFQTAFTVSIEARSGVTTGISAADRARTIHAAIDPAVGRREIVSPGHIFPLRARPGGVLQRAGHTEAGVDLTRLAGLTPAAVICEIMSSDGSMARVPGLVGFCEHHGLRMITVAELVAYRRDHDAQQVAHVVTANLPTSFGAFRVMAFRSTVDDGVHVALVLGDVAGEQDVLVRVHSQCLTGELFDSLRCDCGEQLRTALSAIEHEGRGVLVYLAQEGRGIGLINKLRAYGLQDLGWDTVDANLELGLPADARDYAPAAQILAQLGVTTLRLLTNNPDKTRGLERHGLVVAERVPITHPSNPHNAAYLQAKEQRMGHILGDRAPGQRDPVGHAA